MKKERIYNQAVASAPSGYHKAKRGGNKDLINSLEISHYNNAALLRNCVMRYKSNNINNTTMETTSIRVAVDSYVQDSRIIRVLALRALRSYLVNSDGREIGLLLFNEFVKHSNGLTLVPLTANEIEDGAKVVKAFSLTDKSGKTVCRSSWGLSSRSITGVLVSTSFSSFFSYLRASYNLASGDSELRKRLAVADSLLSYNKGGRVAASETEKAQKKATKAVEALTKEQKLKLLANSLGISLDALTALQADK